MPVQGWLFRIRITRRLSRQLSRLLQERGRLSEGQARQPVLPVRRFIHRQTVRGEIRVCLHCRRSCRSRHLPHLVGLAYLDDLRSRSTKQENAGEDSERGHGTEWLAGKNEL